jgi:hypothetical protein
MSESGYNLVDAGLNYQYRAFGVPGLGLKRGLTEDLVVAPYATALALMVAPEAACLNLQRLAREGLEAKFGFYEAVDYTPSRLPRGQSSAIVRSFMAHHQGMILLSLGCLILDRPMQKRFASDPLFQSTILLLQERIPKPTTLHSSSAGLFDVHARSIEPEIPVRVLSSPDTAIPEVQLLSNGRYHVMVTNAGGGYSRWKDLAVTRWREDTTCDNWGAFCYLRDVASGAFWSSAHQPTLERADAYEAIFSEGRAEFRRRDHEYETYTEIVVSPEDDIELRRVRITNRARTRRTIDVTSYAEVVLAPPAADALHPAFSNLFVQTEIIREHEAILCTRRPRSVDEQLPWMFHVMAVHGAESSAVSFETDRMRFVGRTRTVNSPRAMTEGAALSNSQGSVLDPIVAVRHRIVLDAGTDCHDRRGFRNRRHARCFSGADREVPRQASCGSRLRSRLDAQLGESAPDQCQRIRRATLRPPGRLGFLRQSFLARRGERSHRKSAGPVGPVGLRHIRRPADRVAADRGLRQYRTRASTGAGALPIGASRGLQWIW